MHNFDKMNSLQRIDSNISKKTKVESVEIIGQKQNQPAEEQTIKPKDEIKLIPPGINKDSN